MASDPTKEIGNAGNGIMPWNSFADESEPNAELSWPASVRTYDKMRNDPQVAGLLWAFVLPILGYRWYLDPNGARDEVVEDCSNDLGVEIEGYEQPTQGRLRDRFDHTDHLRQALLDLVYGWMMFEQVYRYGENDQKLHIRKLAPRLPGSISEVAVAPDGGLDFIRQHPSGMQSGVLGGRGAATSLFGLDSPKIPVDRLVAYVNDKEGGNWYGRSLLRACYSSWLVKDRLIRVDALKHERNGMGVPTGKAGPNTKQKGLDKLLSVVRAWKVGDTSAAVLPEGTDIELKGVQGSLPDTLASISYYDEALARRFLAMFMQLGSTQSGSRALGETFVDFFSMAQASVAKSYAETTTAHVIEDLVDLNYGIDENAPILRFRAEGDRKLAITDLTNLIKVGAITVDDETEAFIRAEHDLPELSAGRTEEEDEDAPIPLRPAARQHIHVTNEAAKPRKKTDIEKRAGTDFEALRKAFDAALDDLVKQWTKDVKPSQVDQLTAAIAALAPDDFDGFTNLTASPLGSVILSDALNDMADDAAKRAQAEMKSQGVELDAPDLTLLKRALTQRAEAIDILMANSIAQAASTAALAEAGGAIDSGTIADHVGEYLDGLGDTYLRDQLGGTLMAAQNASRLEVFDAVPAKRLYSSELNDNRQCALCAEVDGTEYDSIAEAKKDYPSGRYVACLGGNRCRGVIVAVAETEEEPSK